MLDVALEETDQQDGEVDHMIEDDKPAITINALNVLPVEYEEPTGQRWSVTKSPVGL